MVIQYHVKHSPQLQLSTEHVCTIQILESTVYIYLTSKQSKRVLKAHNSNAEAKAY